MIALKNTTIHYGKTVALDDISLKFPEGQITALVGGDGAGKSTLLQTLALRVPGVRAHDLSRTRIGYQPAQSGTWGNLSVAENIDFATQAYGVPRAVARQRAAEDLETAGLAHVHKRLASKLSGGMRQKLGFIMATLHHPELVLLDEPTTGVDPVSRSELWNLISLATMRGSTIVIATTYLDEAERAGQVVLLDQGAVLAHGTPEEIISTTPGHIWEAPIEVSSLPEHHWRRANTRYAWTPKEQPSGFTATIPDLENSSIARLMASEDGNRAGLPIDFAAGEGVLAQADAVTRRFGSFTALDNVSIAVKPGEVMGLLGGNGAGKTTLMRIILGLESPTSGQVALFGAPPTTSGRTKLGYVAQGLGLYPSLSARENLQFAAGAYGVRDEGMIRQVAREFGSGPVKDLPLGARRLLAFRTATLHRPQLLILDEPTSGMDPLGRAQLWDQLGQAADQGVGILVTTHYMQEAQQCAMLVMLNAGRVTTSGTLAQVTGTATSIQVSTPHWEEAFRLLKGAGRTPLLDGTTIRVPYAKISEIEEILTQVKQVTIDQVPAALDEAMLG